jgi:hypothetical protein
MEVYNMKYKTKRMNFTQEQLSKKAAELQKYIGKKVRLLHENRPDRIYRLVSADEQEGAEIEIGSMRCATGVMSIVPV